MQPADLPVAQQPVPPPLQPISAEPGREQRLGVQDLRFQRQARLEESRLEQQQMRQIRQEPQASPPRQQNSQHLASQGAHGQRKHPVGSDVVWSSIDDMLDDAEIIYSGGSDSEC